MTVLLPATLQASAILVVVLGALQLLRKRTAALRHAVIAMALGCAAIVPLLGVIVPPWIAPAIALPGMHELMLEPALPDAASEIPWASPAENQTARSPAETLPTGRAVGRGEVSAWIGWARLAVIAYGTGLAIALALLALATLRLAWLAARSEPVRAEAWLEHCDAVARAYGLRRRVMLKQSSHATLLATWGFLRPQVLLPDGAGHWPDARIRAVLLHELAHIRRNDW